MPYFVIAGKTVSKEGKHQLIYHISNKISFLTGDLPTVVIAGKMVSKEGVSNTKSVFILVKDGETTYCNVEELVRDYYKVQVCFEIENIKLVFEK